MVSVQTLGNSPDEYNGPQVNPAPPENPPQDSDLSGVESQVVGGHKPPISLTLPSGRKIEFKKPQGALSMRVAELLGENSANQAMNIYYRMLLCISKLDSIPVSPPISSREVKLLADRLGDDFDMAVFKFSQGDEKTGELSIAEQIFGNVEDVKK